VGHRTLWRWLSSRACVDVCFDSEDAQRQDAEARVGEETMMLKANKRCAGKGGFAVLWRAERSCPALPDRERSATPL
jgi:hypothetical protein